MLGRGEEWGEISVVLISLSDMVTGEMLGRGEEWGGGDKCCFDQFVRHGNRGKCWEGVRNGGEISVVLISLSDMVTGEMLGSGEEWGGDKCCFDQFVRHGNRGNVGKG